MTHQPALDGVRGIAILLVLFHHFTVFDPITGVGAWLGFAALLGWCGVDLFFVLSGFLITGILIDARGSSRYFSSFYMRRSLRIFPLYFLVVFLSFVVLPRFPALHDVLAGPTDVVQWPYWTYLVNFAIADRAQFLHGILDISWSLAIEEQFYIVWAVVVWALPVRWLGPAVRCSWCSRRCCGICHSMPAPNPSRSTCCRIFARTRSHSGGCWRGSRVTGGSRASEQRRPTSRGLPSPRPSPWPWRGEPVVVGAVDAACRIFAARAGRRRPRGRSGHHVAPQPVAESVVCADGCAPSASTATACI
jgi:hypothetical protein